MSRPCLEESYKRLVSVKLEVYIDNSFHNLFIDTYTVTPKIIILTVCIVTGFHVIL
jgi:hypothetical protein